MKNVCLTLAFMLVGMFAFAEDSVPSDIDIEKIESLIHSDHLDSMGQDFIVSPCGFDVFYDDGTDGDGPWGGSGSFFQPIPCGGTFDLIGWLDSVFAGWDSACMNC